MDNINITLFLNSRGHTHFEGYSQQIPPQVMDLRNLVNTPGVKRVMEIGFNAGHSAEVFLRANPNIHLVSFDLGEHDYVRTAKEYIDIFFPGRHTLILGDSTVTIPEYISKHNSEKFDLIFIDGGHEYSIAKADLSNCQHLAHKDSIVIIDDTTYTPGWEASYTVGPTRTWMEHLEQNKVTELCRREYCPGRGMTWGRYLLN